MESICKSEKINGDKYSYDADPKECPFCHLAIKPVLLASSLTGGSVANSNTLLENAYRCPRNECGYLFIGQYHLPHDANNVIPLSHYDQFSLFCVRPGTPPKYHFSPIISHLSPDFIKMYEQSTAALAYGLPLAAGAGYWKSLKILVKDYCCSMNKSNSNIDIIDLQYINNCINDHSHGSALFKHLNESAWLDIDGVHCNKLWTYDEVLDLKKSIFSIINWISSNEPLDHHCSNNT